MNYIGLMSGTSMDAVDTALVRIENDSLELLCYEEFPIDDAIRNPVRMLAGDSPPDEITRFDILLADLFANAVLRILQLSGVAPDEIRAIGSHGQTILHLPDAIPPRTLQIGSGLRIAQATGITTVSDFRSKDLEAGGQGAPLAPALHANQFRSPTVNRCILNLGGIANITVLPADSVLAVTGFDTGPGNGLLDDWNRRHNRSNMDKDGVWAGSGVVNETLLGIFLADPYFFRPAPKSSGRDYFNLAWVDEKLGKLTDKPNPADVQATLLRLSAMTIADAIKNLDIPVHELYMCGGGAHNPLLVRTLKTLMPGVEVFSTGALGMNPDAVEAITFAWLAMRRLDGLPGNLPSVTGAREAVLLGSIFEPVKSTK